MRTLCAVVVCFAFGDLAAQTTPAEDWVRSVRSAGVAFRAGQAVEAERILRQAIFDAPDRKIDAADVGVVWSLLGPVYEHLDRFDAAETAYTNALRVFDAARAPHDDRVVRALANLLMFYVRTNQLGKAGQLAARVRDAAASDPPGDQTAWAWNALGVLSSRTGAFEEAEESFRRALSIEHGASEEPLLREHVRSNLAALYLATSRAGSARAMFESILREEEHRVGRDSAQLLSLLSDLAASCSATGDQQAAAGHLERALEITRTKASDSYRVKTDLLSQYAQVLRTLHRNKEANEAAREARRTNAELAHVQTGTQVVHVAELTRR